MKKRFQKLLRKVKSRSGQGLVEYALILALVVIVSIIVLTGLGGGVKNVLKAVNNNLPAPGTPTG
jgi:pilus assembly protein Flp/PilA